MKVAIVLGLLSLGVVAQAILIDDFSTSYTQSTQSGSWVDFQSGGMLGGERDVQVNVLGNPSNQFSDIDITGTGSAVFSNGFGAGTAFTLQYDRTGDEATNTGAGKLLTNGGTGVALMPGASAVKIEFIGNDLEVMVTLTTRLSGVVTGTESKLRAPGSGPGLMMITMPVAKLGAADSISLEFKGVPSADFAIRRIESVPEPTSVVALTMALSAIFLKKRNR